MLVGKGHCIAGELGIEPPVPSEYCASFCTATIAVTIIGAALHTNAHKTSTGIILTLFFTYAGAETAPCYEDGLLEHSYTKHTTGTTPDIEFDFC